MRLELIPYQRDFLEPFIQWRYQAASVAHNPLKKMGTDEIRKMLENEGTELADIQKHESFRWFVRMDDQVVGNVSLKNVNHMMRYAELGYGISEEHHGRGIATAALRIVINRAFAESILRKLIALVHDQNKPSCRVLEKLGFQKEGILREHFLINGNPENEIQYGLLKQEWQANPD